MRAIVMLLFSLALVPAIAAENRVREVASTETCLYAGLRSSPGETMCLSPQIIQICYAADDKHPLAWWGMSKDDRCSQK